MICFEYVTAELDSSVRSLKNVLFDIRTAERREVPAESLATLGAASLCALVNFFDRSFCSRF